MEESFENMEESFELVKTFPYSAEAHICKGRLEAEGIEVYLHDHNTVDANPLLSQAVGGVKVFVPTEDAARAREILASIPEFSVDDKGDLLKCPNCGATEIEMMTSVKDEKSFLSFLPALLFGALPFVKYRYKCRSCNFEFKMR